MSQARERQECLEGRDERKLHPVATSTTDMAPSNTSIEPGDGTECRNDDSMVAQILSSMCKEDKASSCESLSRVHKRSLSPSSNVRKEEREEVRSKPSRAYNRALPRTLTREDITSRYLDDGPVSEGPRFSLDEENQIGHSTKRKRVWGPQSGSDGLYSQVYPQDAYNASADVKWRLRNAPPLIATNLYCMIPNPVGTVDQFYPCFWSPPVNTVCMRANNLHQASFTGRIEPAYSGGNHVSRPPINNRSLEERYIASTESEDFQRKDVQQKSPFVETITCFDHGKKIKNPLVKPVLCRMEGMLQSRTDSQETKDSCFAQSEPAVPPSKKSRATGSRRLCRMESCREQAVARSPHCKMHSGTRKCEEKNCNKCAQGRTRYCISHGGGRRCIHPHCSKAARDRMYCASHGGGKRCTVDGCQKLAIGGYDACTAHGGGRRCRMDGCPKSAQSGTDFCVRHGGGKLCVVHGCMKVGRGKSSLCMSHGGHDS